MSFQDKTLTCRDCNQTFTFTSGEQEFYASRGLMNEPGRCPDCRSIRLELLAEARDMHLERVRGHRIVITEDLGDQPLLRHDLAGFCDQPIEHRPFAGPQLQGSAANLRRGMSPVDGQIADDHHRAGIAVVAPQQRPDARTQFAGIERFQQVIVRSQIESLYPIGHVIAGG